MKKLLIFLFLVSNVTFSQTLNSDGNGYYKIIKADSLSKEQIHNKSKEWVVLNYKSANDVIQLDSKDKIITKGNFNVTYLENEQTYYHTMILSFKDNRFKMELIINSFSINSLGSQHVKIDNDFLSRSKEKIIKRNNSSVYSNEDNVKKIFIAQFIKNGFSEKKALKSWEKNKSKMLSYSKIKPPIDFDAINNNLDKIEIKVKYIFKSIEDYINNKKAKDGW